MPISAEQEKAILAMIRLLGGCSDLDDPFNQGVTCHEVWPDTSKHLLAYCDNCSQARAAILRIKEYYSDED